MKNRNLLIGLLVLVFGSGLFALTTSGTFRQVAHFPGSGLIAEGVAEGWEYISQIGNHETADQVIQANVSRTGRPEGDLKSSDALGLNWLSMGPDNFSGRTRSLIIDNRESSGSTLYVGSVAGGLWKSTTRGQTWDYVETGDVVLNVSAMAQASNGDIYVGTGESTDLFEGFYPYIIDRLPKGQGIFKSSDGVNFSKLASTADGSWNYINKISISDNRIFAVNASGLKYSTDGGSSWNSVEIGVDPPASNCDDVSVGPDGAIAASYGSQLYISSNGDVNNFVLRSTGTGLDSLPTAGVDRIKTAFAPSDGSTIYAVLIADGSVSGFDRGQLQGVYVSRNKGLTWTVVAPGGSVLFDPFSGNGIYSCSIEVNSTNPDLVYLGGINVWEGRKISETGFYQWQQKTVGEIGVYIHTILPDPSNSQRFYFATNNGVGATEDNFSTFKRLNRNYNSSMFNTVAFDDKGNAMGGLSNGALLYMNKQGNTPETGEIIGIGGGTVEVSMINPTSIFFSGSGNEFSRSQDLGVSLADAFIPDAIGNLNGGYITPFKLWESFNNENSRDSVYYKDTTMTHLAGETVTVKSKASFTSSKRFPFKYTLPYDLVKGDSVRVKDIISSRLFLGVTDAVYMTKDPLNFSKEPDWYKIAEITGHVTCLAYSADANYLFVGTSEGQLIRVANIALAYDSIRADVSSSGCIISNTVILDTESISSVSVDPLNENRVIVTCGGQNTIGVYYTLNAIDESPVFNPAQGNLSPYTRIYTSLIEMNDPDRVIIGTERGIYTTESLGANTTWTAENSGMGNVPVMMIRQQTTSRPWIDNITGVSNLGAIYVATMGKGIFENRSYVGVDGHDTPGSRLNNSVSVYPNPVKSVIHVRFDLSVRSNVQAGIYDLRGNLLQAEGFGNLNKGDQDLSIDAGHLKQGTYLLKLTVGNEVRSAKFVVVK
ncbi:MAG: T9SS type A sorting domain-containing protein [Bacteroidales bacterium]|nr:T9SS type A sorting domain-containing protein [Bacteroidales bacterium]